MGTLKVDVIEAADLIAADSNGKSDPYVTLGLVVDDSGKLEKQHTKIIYKTLNPTWNQSFTFNVDYKSQGFIFRVWDHDMVGTNDPLGHVLIELASLPDEEPQDMWLTLQEVEHGRLHVKMLWTPSAAAPTGSASKGNMVMMLRDETRRLRDAYKALGGNPAAIPETPPNVERLILNTEVQMEGLTKIQKEVVDTTSERLSHQLHSNRSLTWAETSLKTAVFGTAGGAVDCPSVEIPFSTQMPPVPFGAPMRAYFYVGEGFFNCASYGVLPISTVASLKAWEEIIHSDPVLFRLKTFTIRLAPLVSKVTTFVHCDPNDFQFILNPNAAMSAVMKSITWTTGDRLVYLSCDTEANKAIYNWVKAHHPVEVIEIQVPLPTPTAGIAFQLKTELEALLASGPVPRIASFSHVSAGGYILPAKEIVSAFHKYKIPVCIDGSQAVGQFPIDINTLMAEYYIGSLDRWCYCPLGTAFLVAQPHCQQGLTTLTVSYNYGHGYEQEFAYYGLQDFSNWLSVGTGLQFVEKVCGGWSRVWDYCDQLAHDAVKLLKERWFPSEEKPLSYQKHSAHYGRMPTIPLPGGANMDSAVAAELTAYMLLKHNISALFLILPIRDVPTLCVRLTFQVFNDLYEVDALANAISAINGRYREIHVLNEMPPDVLLP
ncbi:aminotransferase class V-fold PLP-dependent enzyme [Pelomyxa schiedti]|nr:aminotransferase class V-fold PLP-dependent enzyme [Pelomyxa schiedti]